ncbi:hypothetical protein HDR58_05385 [bacterium]|nr:hypothetical protein [bacterium]
MQNKRRLLSIIFAVCVLANLPCHSETLSEVTYPKPPAYRVGISSLPENQYIEAKQEKIKPEKKYAQIGDSRDASVTDMTYADLSIKRLSKEIAKELEYDENDMVADLSLLWQGAATQSDTINFALYKLANPDADKPDSKSIKKVLTTIASMSTLVGASMANPVFAGSSLIGGNILNIMSQDTKALNYKYTRVNDADMIILVRKIEDLQQNAVNLYYDYMSAKKQLDLITKLAEDRKHKFELAQKNNAQRELVVITDAYYRTAVDKLRTAKSDFFAKRAALEQFVGNETFVQFEAELNARESGEKTMPSVFNSDSKAYNETIQNVENFKSELNNRSSERQGQEYDNVNEEPQNQSLSVNEQNEAETTEAVADAPVETESDIAEKIMVPELRISEDLDNTSQDLNSENVEVKASFKDKFKKSKSEKSLQPLEPIVQPVVEVKDKRSEPKLLPLDEIKAPTFESNGYSIHQLEEFGF